jgi:two-component system sensor histidine kinase TctE
VQGLVDTVNSFMVRLQSALDALRHFSGNASHQLRTPLAIIRTQLALASRAGTLEEAHEAAQKGDAAVAHAERILAQLLLMAKIDAAGSNEPQKPAPIDIAALAQQLTADRVPAAADAGIDLGYEGDGPVPARAEPLLFGELLRNLMENAIAYAGPGAEVTVSVRATADGALLTVEDNGPGIAPERRNLVRQRFSRGEHRDAPGMGLGLPIVEEIAALFDAAMTLEDGPGGRGLRVAIRFPAA